MRVVADEFRQAVDSTSLNLPEVPVVANITARPLESLEAIREEMEGQLTTSVRWTATIEYMMDQGVTTFVEIGSKNVLTGLIRRISKGVDTHVVGTPTDVEALLGGEA